MSLEQTSEEETIMDNMPNWLAKRVNPIKDIVKGIMGDREMKEIILRLEEEKEAIKNIREDFFKHFEDWKNLVKYLITSNKGEIKIHKSLSKLKKTEEKINKLLELNNLLKSMNKGKVIQESNWIMELEKSLQNALWLMDELLEEIKKIFVLNTKDKVNKESLLAIDILLKKIKEEIWIKEKTIDNKQSWDWEEKPWNQESIVPIYREKPWDDEKQDWNEESVINNV